MRNLKSRILSVFFLTLFGLILNPFNFADFANYANAAARISENIQAAGGSSTSEASINGRISDNPAQAAEKYFQNDDVTFLIKSSNGAYKVATSKNISNPVIKKGAEVAYNMFENNEQYRKMLQYYKDSYKSKLQEQKDSFLAKIAETDEKVKTGDISKYSAKSIKDYYQKEIEKLEKTKIPSLTLVLGQDPNETVSYMMPSRIEYKDKDGKDCEAPAYIMFQQEELEGCADDSKKIGNLVVLAHETGHSISFNATGSANITINYKDPNPLFVVDDQLKNDSRVVELMSKGDPFGNSHWYSKPIHPVTAFEEGFADFTGSFFNDAKFDTEKLGDKDFKVEKIGYKITIKDGKAAADYVWTENLKTEEELANTEFFIAKVLYRCAMAFDNPYDGYSAVLSIKTKAEFKSSPDIKTFLKIFADSYPEQYIKFRSGFNKEIAQMTADANKNKSRYNGQKNINITNIILKSKDLITSVSDNVIKAKNMTLEPVETAEVALDSTSEIAVGGVPNDKSGNTAEINVVKNDTSKTKNTKKKPAVKKNTKAKSKINDILDKAKKENIE
ncbi:MAG: hypothetical protein QMC67_01715 [Candidatus Wallbacteria bacterium]